MNSLKEIMKSEGMKKLIAIIVLFGLIFSLKSMFNLILLTFIFTFIFSSIQNLLFEKINKFIPIKRSLITIVLYLSTIVGLVVAGIKYLPLLGKQLVSIGTQISSFDLKEYSEALDPRLFHILESVKLHEYISEGAKVLMESVPHIGEFSLHLVLAILLSFFFILEKDKILKYGTKVEKSKIGFIYNYYKVYGESFLNSFGKVLNVQILISFINAILTVIVLGFLGFSQVIGLGFMTFIFGLIPVAGVIISFIPISIIAFSIGGITKVLWVIVLILVLHALESYVLNPKIMSVKTELPIFFTFVVLVLGETFLGIWGLLIGLPLFMFFLDITGITDAEADDTSKPKKVKNKKESPQ